ncbi:hypothetical protein E1B28_000250 [Marasmius oreades]|uniref:Vacuolar sorting protein Vps3844 C-terminal domain-containing protein n=1 Tax=Marasmius oreades TaxID=181124 RepID=A0A9P7V128_9AGAR|nr:uncharacterized protein E1B28_000250 [Marasmius oreades]KAG7098287.1 hypothetical protein E1B28_000250 [Marasmius oreades]
MQLSIVSLSLCLSLVRSVQAVNVYLWPSSSSFSPQLSPEDASSALSHHLGLEIYESVRDSFKGMYEQESFVAQDQTNALIVTVDETDARAFLPSTLPPSFKLLAPSAVKFDSLTSVLSTYLHRAKHAYSSIYEVLSSTWDGPEISSLFSFIETTEEPAFAALDLLSLSRLRADFGSDSVEYQAAVDNLRRSVQTLVEGGRVKLAILTHESSPTHSSHKREEDPLQSQTPIHAPPQHPIDSVSTCFTSADICNNATSTCTGHGKCVQATKIGKTCFVCACTPTRTGKGGQVKTVNWAGESCERKDISGPFVLLAGTTIVMILLAFGSVSFLYSVGQQSLPPTLMGTAVNLKKD